MCIGQTAALAVLPCFVAEWNPRDVSSFPATVMAVDFPSQEIVLITSYMF